MDLTAWTGPLFDPSECKSLISELDEKLTVGDSAPGDPDRLRVRNSELSERIKSKLVGVRQFVGGDFSLSPLWFYTRYGPGAGLSPHYDGQFKCGDQTSVATLLVYLNDDFEGGTTAFLDDDENVLSEVVPVAGMALVLKQDSFHMAAAVTKGVKYLLRTDVMVAPKTVCLPRFELSDIEPHAFVVIVGFRGRGVTSLIKSIVSNPAMKLAGGVVFNPQEPGAKEYADLPCVVHDEYDAETVQAYIDRRVGRVKREYVVFDDCLCDPRWSKSVPVRTLIKNKDRIRTTVVMGFMLLTGMRPSVLAKVDHVFLFSSSLQMNRRRLHKMYAPSVPYEEFDAFMDALGRQECLVINKTGIALYKIPNRTN